MRRDRGNALFLVLIAVALFAALSYAVTQSGRGRVGGGISKERAGMIAAQYMQYAGDIQQAITRMRLTSCADDQITFENPNEPGVYTNPKAPVDKRCHVFDPAGGNIPWQSGPGKEIFWSQALGGYRFYTGNFWPIIGVGDTFNHDVYIVLEGLTSVWGLPPATGDALTAVCRVINQRAGTTPSIWTAEAPLAPNPGFADIPFVGDYIAAAGWYVAPAPDPTAPYCVNLWGDGWLLVVYPVLVR